jgi:hypothetical protein
MSKSQMRGNREHKKAKKEQPKVIAAAPSLKGIGVSTLATKGR